MDKLLRAAGILEFHDRRVSKHTLNANETGKTVYGCIKEHTLSLHFSRKVDGLTIGSGHRTVDSQIGMSSPSAHVCLLARRVSYLSSDTTRLNPQNTRGREIALCGQIQDWTCPSSGAAVCNLWPHGTGNSTACMRPISSPTAQSCPRYRISESIKSIVYLCNYLSLLASPSRSLCIYTTLHPM